jgi:hypothetical protein
MAELKTYRGGAQIGMIKEVRGDSYDLNNDRSGLNDKMPREKRGECHPGRSPMNGEAVKMP